MSGNYNILLIIMAPNLESLRAFVEKNLRSLSNIRKLDFSIGDIVYPTFLPVRIMTPKECIEKCKKCEDVYKRQI